MCDYFKYVLIDVWIQNGCRTANSIEFWSCRDCHIKKVDLILTTDTPLFWAYSRAFAYIHEFIQNNGWLQKLHVPPSHCDGGRRCELRIPRLAQWTVNYHFGRCLKFSAETLKQSCIEMLTINVGLSMILRLGEHELSILMLYVGIHRHCHFRSTVTSHRAAVTTIGSRILKIRGRDWISFLYVLVLVKSSGRIFLECQTQVSYRCLSIYLRKRQILLKRLFLQSTEDFT